jgi:hypothetical protein
LLFVVVRVRLALAVVVAAERLVASRFRVAAAF